MLPNPKEEIYVKELKAVKVSFQQLTKNHHVLSYRLTGTRNLTGLPRNRLVYFIQLDFGKSMK